VSTISIIIADDHPVFRRGLRQSIEEDLSFSLLGEASDGDAALALIERVTPDVAVLDVDMPKRSGLEVAHLARELNLSVALVILTIYNGEDIINEALDAGVLGYVMKETAVIDILEAIKAAAAGVHYLSPAISGHLVRRNERSRQLRAERPALTDLTPAERRILRLIALNKTSKEIAEVLGVSFRTVESHRTNIAAKLDIRGTHSLLKFALRHSSFL
jgi:DNA-binding NarL/FixJ family response regulator